MERVSKRLLASVILVMLSALVSTGTTRAEPNSTQLDIHGYFGETCYGATAPGPCWSRYITVEVMVNGQRDTYLALTDSYGFAHITIPQDSNSALLYWWVQAEQTLADAGSVPMCTPCVLPIYPDFLGGDANTDNIVNAVDYTILRVAFGKGCGDPGYDQRADFNRNCVVDGSDFAELKKNFGLEGALHW